MNWNFLITFGIGLGVYFIGLIGYVLVKRAKNKKSFKKEEEENEKQDEEKQD